MSAVCTAHGEANGEGELGARVDSGLCVTGYGGATVRAELGGGAEAEGMGKVDGGAGLDWIGAKSTAQQRCGQTRLKGDGRNGRQRR
ncbi:hypothetical protein M0R45_030872 [Rubus argutus]|uniref:Uncharacterized protein n=1 Tax=Rubus argutus TaxID=59490 RepID=A0AAW1WD34_RUBAR